MTVNNSGDIHTRGYGSAGIVAQSVGGGGGVAGAAAAGSEGKYGGGATVSVGAGIGLAGGNAGNGGEIEVTNAARIQTDRDQSNGLPQAPSAAAAASAVRRHQASRPSMRLVVPWVDLAEQRAWVALCASSIAILLKSALMAIGPSGFSRNRSVAAVAPAAAAAARARARAIR
ncbi:hypothetical protein MES5069_210080 [Mesorhizobium escarrei]|uniref:Uncharacterized protein n=1 Tax=Mesorhizobium escarrei TaxID=666018 RepID=A0ABN8JT20_9HYPH|nr:hypothetical protein MES5069_210080 [Mesorhizobium escarrei]